MIHILKSYEQERVRNLIVWKLTVYDDVKEEVYIKEIFQYMEDEA